MSKKSYLFTSESVSEGHPDKVSDRISDMVVDTYLAAEPIQSRVGCETLTTTNRVVLAGEVRGPEIKKEELIQKVRDCIKDIGYDQEGFTWKDATKIESHLHAQSTDIAMGVDSSGNKDEGAGDQGIMFGYACNETDVLMPAPIHYSHKILRLMAEDRKSGKLKNIEPDNKSQITIEYKDGIPAAVKSVVISTQHSADVNQSQVRELVKPYIEKSIPKNLLTSLDEKEIYVNPTGNFVIGGPDGDAGLTGRKIIVDTYGGAAPHGGGAFSGKDPSKVDRSAAYVSRYLAKNIVASKIADKCLIQLAYAIGVSKPLSIYVDLFDNDEEKNKHVEKLIKDNFDLSPRGIREMLALNKPIYQKTAAYGHFGREPESDGSFSWEKTDKTSVFQK
jgi:S-adenosylmethionine synthetase